MAKKNKFSAMTILCIGVLCVGIVFFNLQTKSKVIEGVGAKNLRWSEECTRGLRNQGKTKGNQSCVGQTRFRYGGGHGQDWGWGKLYYGEDSNDT